MRPASAVSASASLERRMRERWRTISSMWDQNKSPNNKLDLLGQLDYYGKLSAQLEWRRDPGDRPGACGVYAGWSTNSGVATR